MDIFQIPIYPAANLFPMLDEESLQELADDIAENGLRDPIVLKKINGDVFLIDGRNRRAACKSLGIEPDVRWLPDAVEDPTAYVVSTNINRRHLTKGQKAMVLAQIYPEPKRGMHSEFKNQTGDVSKTALSFARTVLKHAPDLVPAVMSGYSLDEAYKQATALKRSAESVENRLAAIRDGYPDVASLVEEGRLTVEGAESEIAQRKEHERQRVAGLNKALEAFSMALDYVNTDANVDRVAAFVRDEGDMVASNSDPIDVARALHKQLGKFIKEAQKHAD